MLRSTRLLKLSGLCGLLALFVFFDQLVSGYSWKWDQLLDGSIHHEHFILAFLIAAFILFIVDYARENLPTMWPPYDSAEIF